MEFYNKMTVQGGEVTKALFGQNAGIFPLFLSQVLIPSDCLAKRVLRNGKKIQVGAVLHAVFIFNRFIDEFGCHFCSYGRRNFVYNPGWCFVAFYDFGAAGFFVYGFAIDETIRKRLVE